MADENDLKTSAVAGQNGTKSPVESPVGVPALSRKTSVYVMTCQSFVKIGYTRDVWYRLGVHQVGNPFSIDLIGWVEFPTEREAQGAESRMHVRFAPWRVRGEWYEIDPQEAMQFLADGAEYVRRGWAKRTDLVVCYA